MLLKTKFKDPLQTCDGTPRAHVQLKELKTLWFNTGTRCNLACQNCYIESSPTNDRLLYLTLDDVRPYLQEIKQNNWGTTEIAFTGGEPFLNPHFMSILEEVLNDGFEALVLTNAYRVLERHWPRLLQLQKRFADKLLLRVSLDHYSREVHEAERGSGTFDPTLDSLAKLAQSGLQVGVAGRSLTKEALEDARAGYCALFVERNIELDVDNPRLFVIFPEMDEMADVPEITVKCWDILGKSPDQMMCASGRMIVKRKGEARPVVLPCTLLPYDLDFELGHTLADSRKVVSLNHPHCAKFCVLGGASCSGA